MLNNIGKNAVTGDPPSGCGPLLDRSKTGQTPLRQQIFQFIRASGQATRTDVTRALDISAGSATNLTADLIALGVVKEVDDATRDSSRGRPPVALQIVPEAAYVIGIKLTLARHSGVLLDFAGNVIASAALDVPEKRRTAARLLDEIANLMGLLCRRSQKPANAIKAVGVGMPGIIDHAIGGVTWSSLLVDGGENLRGGFAQRHNIPLFVDNDTNMLTIGELWFGEGRAKTDFAVVTIEDGVGMGLVLNNQIYRGTHGMGLELGHTKVQLDGALCRCGQRGCLEAYLADYALTREAATALDQIGGDLQDPKDLLDMLFQQASNGNAAAETIFRRAGRYLSVGLANVVQLFDPPLIILSGKRMQYGYLYADTVLAEMQKLTLSNGRQPCDIAIHPWDDLVWARGATVPALSALTDAIVGGNEMAMS